MKISWNHDLIFHGVARLDAFQIEVVKMDNLWNYHFVSGSQRLKFWGFLDAFVLCRAWIENGNNWHPCATHLSEESHQVQSFLLASALSIRYKRRDALTLVRFTASRVCSIACKDAVNESSCKSWPRLSPKPGVSTMWWPMCTSEVSDSSELDVFAFLQIEPSSVTIKTLSISPNPLYESTVHLQLEKKNSYKKWHSNTLVFGRGSWRSQSSVLPSPVHPRRTILASLSPVAEAKKRQQGNSNRKRAICSSAQGSISITIEGLKAEWFWIIHQDSVTFFQKIWLQMSRGNSQPCWCHSLQDILSKARTEGACPLKLAPEKSKPGCSSFRISNNRCCIGKFIGKMVVPLPLKG